MRRRHDSPIEGVEVLGEAEAVGLDLLLAWITDGPPRPPTSREELVEWAADRGPKTT